MIMKVIAILSLILVFWCHQSHHHLFMLIGTGPLSLASEDFIQYPSEPAVKNEHPVHEGATGRGSQSDSDKKSDILDANVVKLVHPKTSEQDGNGDKINTQESAPTPPVSNDPALVDTGSILSHNNPTDSGDNENKVVNVLPRDSVNEDIDLIKSTIKSLNEAENINSSSVNISYSEKPDNESDDSVITKPEPPYSGLVPSPPPQVPQKEDEPIPSFMEWTQIQQKLQESNQANVASVASTQAQGQNGNSNTGSGNSPQNQSTVEGKKAAADLKARKGSNAKNFASPDCGAKVVQSNPESQNANGVLSSSHDEYMLNKCGIPVWFIVELCEPLKIEKVSLGNLELFSSSPKAIELGISDRYPTRDWRKLGPFTLPDHRDIHAIQLPTATNTSTFGKFLKVNILSHYGEEHFCPLSLVRVNGISEYEVLESENTHPGEGEIDTNDKEEGALYEEPVMITDQNEQLSTADKSVFGTAKDAVINIVRKVAQVVVKSDHSKNAYTHKIHGSFQSNCVCLLQCLPNYEIQLRDKVSSLLSCNYSNLLPFLSKNSPWCGWDYCHALFSKHSIGLPWQPEGFYASIFGGPSVLHALCNYHRPVFDQSCTQKVLTNASQTSSSQVLDEQGIVNETLHKPVKDASSSDTQIHQKAEPNIADKATTEGQPIVAKPSFKSESKETGQPKEQTETIDEAQPSPTIPHSQTESTSTPNSEEVPVTATPVINAPPQQPPVNSNQQQQQKESVFVRLSNRIKTLERNQTMTAAYLEELSRRFKKQNEENHNFNEGSKAFMNESRVKFKILEDLYKFELRSLRRNTDEIRERLFNVQLQRSVLILLCLVQLVIIVGIFIYVRRRFQQFESRIGGNIPEHGSVTTIVPSYVRLSAGNETPCTSGFRKRINSEISTGSSLNSIEKSKKIKKKKKKLPELKPVNVKVSGPASAPIDITRNEDGEFKFDYPPSSVSAYEITPTPGMYSYKENVNPQTPNKTPTPPGANGFAVPKTPPNLSPTRGIPSAALLSTQVDSPFQMISSTSANFFVDSSVSTSSRFALLASPGGGGVKPPLRRSGSLTSLESSSTSSYNTHNVPNGDNQSQGSNGSSGKKRKNKGLKALMPKIFDR